MIDKYIPINHSLTHITLILYRVSGSLEPIPGDSGHEVGYALKGEGGQAITRATMLTTMPPCCQHLTHCL